MKVDNYTESDLKSSLEREKMLALVKGIPIKVCLEKVHGRPAQNVKSVTSFMDNYGWLRGVCMGLGFPLELTPPAVWTKAMGSQKKKGESAKESKDRRKALLQMKIPHWKWYNYNVDAFLIAEYCKKFLD